MSQHVGQAESLHPALALYDAGYTQLIPVIPPGAELSPRSAIAKNQRGKSPGCKGAHGWHGLPGWQKYQPTRRDVEKWIADGASIGLRTSAVAALDVDIEDETVASLVLAELQAIFGNNLIRRVGRAPRFAVFVRATKPLKKSVLEVCDANGASCGKIELSGDGNQVVVHGVHPRTGEPYYFLDTSGERHSAALLAGTPPDTLPTLTVEGFAEIEGAVRTRLAAAGYSVSTGGSRLARGEDVDQQSLRAPSMDALREAVSVIPNETTRPEWLTMLMAIHAAAGRENEADARDIALDWCARWEGGDDPAESARVWDTLQAPHVVGWDLIARRAGEHGFNSAVHEFAVDPTARASTLPPPPADRGRTDMGNAGRFARRYRDKLCYVNGGWLEWDGKRYAPIDSVHVERLAKQVVREMYAEASRIGDADLRDKLVKWALTSEKAERIGGMVRLARGELARDIDDFDKDPYALTVHNGILDLRTGQLRKATAEDPVRLIAGTHFDPTAIAPLWESFLATIFDNDRELIDYVQRLCGYALTGDTKEQMLAFLHGDGANGKSTFLETLRAVLGEYAAQAPFSQFAANSKSSVGGASPEIARLRGKRAVMASESRRGARLDETQIKSLTGGDTIVGRELYKPHQEFRPQFKLLGAVNHKPELPSDDPAVWRRMHLIPFGVTIPVEARDPGLPAKLRAELPGILAWMVRGCLKWQQEGLNPPPAVVQATASYRAEMDEVSRFIHECCELQAQAEIGASELHQAFCAWRAVEDELLGSAMSQREFGQRLRRHDPGRINARKSSNAIYVGIRLTSATRLTC